MESRGVLGQLRARIRAEVFSALEDPTDAKPEVSRENFIINELIREYLDYNHYKYTSSVLSAETGMSGQRLDRQFLADELKVTEDKSSASVPLLYGIVGHFAARSQGQSSVQKPNRLPDSHRTPEDNVSI